MDEIERKPGEWYRVGLGRNPTGQWMILTAMALLSLGVVMVHSAMGSVRQPGQWYQRVDIRHTIFAGMALCVLLVCWRLDYRWFRRGRWPWLAIGVLVVALTTSALVYVPGIGYAAGGKYRWIRVGPRDYSIGFQPSELLKIALVLFLAVWLTRPGRKVKSVWTFLFCGVLVAGCAGLVVTQDFGSAMLLATAAGVVMFLAGVPWYYFLAVVPMIGGAFYWFVMRTPFRMHRIQAMLDPWNNDNPASYHAQQSIVAILSGGWEGVGLGNGIRKLGFLPEDSTDFIFASFCEEWGFWGAMLLMGLLLIWMALSRRIAAKSPDPFGRVLAGGLGALIVLQAMLHIAVNMVALPPTGIGFPFLSAGGTSLLLTALGTSIMVSVSAARCEELPDLLHEPPSPKLPAWRDKKIRSLRRSQERYKSKILNR